MYGEANNDSFRFLLNFVRYSDVISTKSPSLDFIVLFFGGDFNLEFWTAKPYLD